MNLHITSFLSATEYSGSFSARAAWQVIFHWFELQQVRHQVRKEREQLAELPEHLLRDIGVSQHQAQIESQRSFKDIPAGRMNCW